MWGADSTGGRCGNDTSVFAVHKAAVLEGKDRIRSTEVLGLVIGGHCQYCFVDRQRAIGKAEAVVTRSQGANSGGNGIWTDRAGCNSRCRQAWNTRDAAGRQCFTVLEASDGRSQ